MKKWFVTFIALLSLLLFSACSDSDKLSGKTFKVSYTPVLQEDIDNPSKYPSIMTLKFSDGNVVTNTIDNEEGAYELNNDVLVINFENENEKLEIEFIEFKESNKDFSAYSTVINNSELEIEDSEQVSKFSTLHLNLSKDMPIEFIEK